MHWTVSNYERSFFIYQEHNKQFCELYQVVINTSVGYKAPSIWQSQPFYLLLWFCPIAHRAFREGADEQYVLVVAIRNVSWYS